MVCTDRAYQLQVARAAHSSDFRPKGFGNLHGKRTYTTGGTINENFLTCLDFAFITQSLQGSECRQRDSCRLLECQPGGLQRQCVFSTTDVFSKTAQSIQGQFAKYIITYLKLRYVFADCFNAPGQVRTQPGIFGFEQSICQSGQERLGSHG